MLASCKVKFFLTLNMCAYEKHKGGFLFLEWICYCVPYLDI